MEDAQPMQLAMLSEQEMRETEGAVAPLAAIPALLSYMGGGAAVGAGVYTAGTL